MQNMKTEQRNTPVDDNLFDVPFVSLIDFVNAEPDTRSDEYVRLFADAERRELRAYRLMDRDVPIDEPYAFVGTVVPNVNVTVRSDRGDPEAYNLHYTHAETLLTWLTALAKERSDARVRFEYVEESGKQMFAGSSFGEEVLLFSYRTETDRTRRIGIDHVYRSALQSMARYA